MNPYLAGLLSVLTLYSCAPSRSVTGNEYHEILLTTVGNQKYESDLSLVYSNKTKKYTLSGWGILTSTAKQPVEPRSIYNKFKCHFVWDGKSWRAEPVYGDNIVSTLNSGYLQISSDRRSARVVNFQYAPFEGLVPSVDFKDPIAIKYQE